MMGNDIEMIKMPWLISAKLGKNDTRQKKPHPMGRRGEENNMKKKYTFLIFFKTFSKNQPCQEKFLSKENIDLSILRVMSK